MVKNNTNEVSTLLAETASCLKELHKICDPLYKDIQMLLWSAQFNDVDEIIKYLRDCGIIKYLRDENCFDPVIFRSCNRLKKIVLITPKKSMNFKKICWTSKKISW